MSGEILPLKRPPTLLLRSASAVGSCGRFGAGLPSAFACFAAACHLARSASNFALACAGSTGRAVFSCVAKKAFNSGALCCVSGAIHDSMGVPPTEEWIKPTGTPSA